MNLTFVDSNYSVHFARNKLVRRAANEFEDALKGLFSAPEVIPVPDEMQAEIPRLVLSSPHGHSVLEISQSNLSLKTTFDGEFRSNFALVKAYLNERLERLLPTIRKLSGDAVFFCGWAVNVQVPTSTVEEAVGALSKVLVKPATPRAPFDVGAKFVFTLEDKYFLNVAAGSFRQYSGVASQQRLSPANLTLSKAGIALQVDVNDRFAFNTIRDYTSSPDVPSRLIDLVEHALTTTVPALIEKGMVEL